MSITMHFECIKLCYCMLHELATLHAFMILNRIRSHLKSVELTKILVPWEKIDLFWNSAVAFFTHPVKPVFHNANLFARREAKTEMRHRDWSAKKVVTSKL